MWTVYLTCFKTLCILRQTALDQTVIGTAEENKCTNYSDTYNFIGLCFIRLTKMFLSLFFYIINVTWINGRLFLFQVYILSDT